MKISFMKKLAVLISVIMTFQGLTISGVYANGTDATAMMVEADMIESNNEEIDLEDEGNNEEEIDLENGGNNDEEIDLENGENNEEENGELQDPGDITINNLNLGIAPFSIPTLVYLSGSSGNDTNDGLTVTTPVKTFAAAKALLTNGGTICIVGKVSIDSMSETWASNPGAKIEVYRDSTLTDSTTIEIINGGSLTVENITIDNITYNSLNAASMITIPTGDSGAKSSITIKDGAILQNSNGPLVNVSSSTGVFTMTGGTITGATKDAEGAVVLRSEENYFSGGKVTENLISAFSVGGTSLYPAKLIMSGTAEISENSNTTSFGLQGGGVILTNPDAEFVMDGGKIHNNEAGLYGGAVCNAAGGTITINDGEIYENSAKYGGAFLIAAYGATYGSSININGGKIYENEADYGGAISIEDGCYAYIKNAEIYDNEASDGAVIWQWGGSGHPATVTIEDSEFYGNNASGSGGVIYMNDYADTIITNSKLHDNSAVNGGSVYSRGYSTIMLEGGTEIYNNSAVSGGGICTYYNSELYVSDTKIYNNTATSAGGAGRFWKSKVTIDDGSLIEANTAPYGSGVYMGDLKEHLYIMGTAVISSDNDVYIERATGNDDKSLIYVSSALTGLSNPIQITTAYPTDTITEDVDTSTLGQLLVICEDETLAQQANAGKWFAPSQEMIGQENRLAIVQTSLPYNSSTAYLVYALADPTIDVTVTYRVVNGKWSDGTNGDISVKVTLTSDVSGVYRGTLDISDIPTGMNAASGFKATGKWDNTPTTVINGITEDVTYTYTFDKKSEDPDPDPNPDVTKEYTLTYYSNNGDGESQSETYKEGDTVTVNTNIFTTPSNKVFKGWSTTYGGSVSYSSGSGFIMPNEDVDLYAVWEDVIPIIPPEEPDLEVPPEEPDPEVPDEPTDDTPPTDNTLVEEDGIITEVDGNGVPLGIWQRDPETNEWIFVPFEAPLGKAPATGDSSDASMYGMFSLAALAAIALALKKKSTLL